jgi:hypothetical protein
MEFSKHNGLCQGVTDMYPSLLLDEYGCNMILDEMLEQFQKAGLSRGFPFGIVDYHLRTGSHTQHRCPRRLAWVLDHINNPPVNQSAEILEFYKAWYKWAIANV